MDINWFGFFVQLHINLPELFNIKVILAEGQLLYDYLPPIAQTIQVR